MEGYIDRRTPVDIWFGPKGLWQLSCTETKQIRLILTHSHTTTPFDAPFEQAFENTAEKGEIAPNEQFLLFPQFFLPIWITFCHFHQI